MKARIKATGEIVNVYNWGEPTLRADNGDIYQKAELDFDVEDENNPNYWTRLEHQAAIAAMGGMCGNTKYNDYAWVDMAKFAIKAAHALVKKLKEKEERK